MLKVIKFANYLDAQIQEINFVRNKKRTRLVFLSTVARLLETENLIDIKVDTVCTAANFGRGTFYLYFKSVDDLFEALLTEYVKFESYSLPNKQQGVGLFDYLLQIVEWYDATFEKNFAVIRALVLLAIERKRFNKILAHRNDTIIDHVLPVVLNDSKIKMKNTSFIRDAMRASGAMIDQRQFQRYGIGQFQKTDKHDRHYYIELHALLMYRAVLGENPPNLKRLTTLPI